VLLHPLGDIVVRQQVVPLDVGITRFGNAPIEDRRTYTVTLSVNGTSTDAQKAVEDYFAPAHYFETSDAEKLSAPSFERHTAGGQITAAGVSFPTDFAVKTEEVYEEEIVDDLTEPEERPPYRLPLGRLAIVASFSAAGRSAATRTGGDRYRAPGVGLRVQEIRYVVADTAALEQQAIAEEPTATEGVSHAAAMAALRQHLATEPAERERLQVVPRYETQEVTP
jgi:hypothetical protein